VGAKYLQSVMIYSLGLCVNVAVFSTVLRQGTIELVALLSATACSFMINFLLSKRFVFAPGSEQSSR
jgi:putative flippase GtrA